MHLACTKWNVKENVRRKASCLLNTIRQMTSLLISEVFLLDSNNITCTVQQMLTATQVSWNLSRADDLKVIKSVWDETVACSQDEQTVFSH